MSRISTIEQSAQLETRLSLQDVSLQRAATELEDLRDTILQDISLNGPSSIDAKLEETFQVLKDAFNSQLAGNYLFAGTLNDTPPVIATDISTLPTPIDGAFVTGAQEQKISIDGFSEVSLAPVASDAAADAMSLLRDLHATGAASPGGSYDPLTDALKTSLQGQLSNLSTVIDDFVQLQAKNGQSQERINASVDSQTLQLNSLTVSIAKITEVDLAEVALQLKEAETAYQASASVFSKVSSLTLLDVL